MRDFSTQTGLAFLQRMIRDGNSSAMASLMNMRLIEASDGVFEAHPSKVAGPDGKLYAHGSGTFLVFP